MAFTLTGGMSISGCNLFAPISNGFQYLNTYNYNSVSTTTLTFSSVDFGLSSTYRKVIVAFSWADGSSGSITGVSINGVTASLVVQSLSTAILRNDEIWIANVPTGSTGDIVITRSASVTGSTCSCSVFAASSSSISLYNTAVSYASTGVGVSSSRSVDINVPANGFTIAAYGCGSAVGTTTWTNITERSDVNLANIIMSAAGNTEELATTKTITAVSTDASVNRPGLIVASWSF